MSIHAMPFRRRPAAIRAALAAAGLAAAAPFPASAQSVSAEFGVNTFGPGDQSPHALLRRETGEFVVVWNSDQQDGSNNGVYARVFAADGTPQGAEIRVNTRTVNDQHPTAAAMDAAGNFVVAWRNLQTNVNTWGIQARLFAADGTPRTAQFDVNTHQPGDQLPVDLEMAADGSFVVLWRSIGQDGDGDGAYARMFNADGTPRGAEIQVNQVTEGGQAPMLLRLQPDGGFFVAWTCTICDGSGDNVQGRLFDADGVPRGDEFRINEQGGGDQTAAFSAVDDAGNILLGWKGPDGSGMGLFARQYLADGTPRGGEFRINEQTSFDQNLSRFAVAANGNFVVVWSHNGLAGREDVRARSFDAAGNPLSGELNVNTFTRDTQLASLVGLDADGNFVVVWRSINQFSSWDTLVRAFAADGTPRSAEVRVNTFVTHYQLPRLLAMDDDGGFVVFWASETQDGSGTGVYARPFRADAVPRIPGEIRLNAHSSGDQAPTHVSRGGDGRLLTLWTSEGQDGSGDAIRGAFLDLSGLPPCDSGTLSFNNPAPTVEESDGRRVFVVNRVGGSCGEVAVAWDAAAGTATAGSDFTPKTGTLAWPDGDAVPRRFTIPILQDAVDEDLETVHASLSAPTGGAAIGGPATLRILDDDPPSRLSIKGTARAPEGSDTSITIGLDAPAATDVTVRIQLGGTAERAVDYVFREQYVTIPAGSLEVTRDLRSDRTDLKDDELVEGDETIVLTLWQPQGARVSETAGAHTITIVDTD